MTRSLRGRSRRKWRQESWALPVCLLGLLTVSQFPVKGAKIVAFANGRTIDAGASDVFCVFAADVDGDGDQDILASSFYDNWLKWYENEDGNGTFSETAHVVNTSDYEGAMSIDVGDLDGDGFPDVVVAFQLTDQVAWFRNTDGQGGFSNVTDIDTDVGGSPSNVKLADIDGDVDLDVVSAWKTGDRFTWYSNADGEGTFAIGLDLSTTANGAYALALADLDGDDDIDVVSASVWDGLAWHENSDGNGVFSLGISLEAGEPAKDVVTADLDGDGDLDIISASYDGSHSSSNYYDGRLFWIENTDGEGTFGEGKDIDWLDSARIVVPVDLDNDGDVDLVACDSVGGRVMWYENTNGQGNFSAAIDIAIDSGVIIVIAVDLDGDEDFDLVTASRDSGRVIWYENLLAEDGATPAPLAILLPTPSSAPMAPTLVTTAPTSSRTSPDTGSTTSPAPVEAEPASEPEAEPATDTGSSDGNNGLSTTLEIFIGVASTVASAVILGAAKFCFSRSQPADDAT